MSDWLFNQPVCLVFLPILMVPWLNFRVNLIVIPFPGLFLLQKETRKQAIRSFLAKSFSSVGLLFIVLGLAQPAMVISSVPVQLEGIAIEFVVDISGSMAEEIQAESGLFSSRLELAKKYIFHFLNGFTSLNEKPSFDKVSINKPLGRGRSGDLIGLIAFASQPKLLVPLTLDHPAFIHVLNKLTPQKIPGTSETNIADALTLAIDRLLSIPDQKKIIILLTDGEQNVAVPVSGLNPIDIAQLSAKLNIPIYTLDTGLPLGRVEKEDKEKRELAQAGLSKLAALTKGKAFDANDEKSMRHSLQEIGEIEKQLRDSFYSKPCQDFYAWFILAGVLFFSLGIFLPASHWQRIS